MFSQTLAQVGQLIALAPRAREQFIGFVAVGEAFGRGVPFERLADLADVADDVDQVTKRRASLAVFDVGVAAFAALDAVGPILYVVLCFRSLLGPGLSGELINSLGLPAILLRLISSLPLSPMKMAPKPGPQSPSRCSRSSVPLAYFMRTLARGPETGLAKSKR